MLFTWDTTNLCIVFRSWRITGTWSLLWSLLAVMALTAGYEAVREACRRYEARQAAQTEHLPSKLTSTPTRRCVEMPPSNTRLYVPKMARRSATHCCIQEMSSRVVGGKVAMWSRRRFMGCRCFIRSLSCKSDGRGMCLTRVLTSSRLLFMTYNGWIMLAVGFGAFFGYLMFGGASATKSAACH